MCGFSGFITKDFKNIDPISILKNMGDAIRHRGPDDSGEWFDFNSGVGLSHQRLSILDLSSAGHQPMHSLSGKYIIVFNGEIYNHLEIRNVLEEKGYKVNWKGHSDTETLLASIDYLGIEETLKSAIGMFAFALWDKEKNILTLGRDRLGEKPLYYGWQGDTFLFGSELKAIRKHPSFIGEIDRGSLALMMRHGYVPSPFSIYKGIFKLNPGNLLYLSLENKEPKKIIYWSGKDIIEKGSRNKYIGNKSDAVNELDLLLKDAVYKQMIASDVPLGAFLSGGVDSSLIVSLMQEQSSKPIKTFSVGFNEEKFNEAGYAKAVAGHLGTDHMELYVSEEDILSVIPKLSELYDEPFADSSQIPTFLVSQMAKKYVDVSLSGDAGDELFCGYSRYTSASKAWNKLSYIPLPLRKLLATSISSISIETLNRLTSPATKIFPSYLGDVNIGDKLHKGAELIKHKNIQGLYHGLISSWNNPEDLVIGAREPATILTNSVLQPKTNSTVESMMAIDLLSYLPDDILTKVDRAAMGVSLETRIPFLDHRVVEFAWKLPLEYKLQDGVSKWILRQVLYKYVPKKLIERPKKGFGVPLAKWLRGPLRDWTELLLNEERLRREGFFNAEMVQNMWQEHLSCKRNWHHQLWNVIMFQSWLEKYNK
jgi:asparagine synthase (glutamine-hydrolysing)